MCSDCQNSSSSQVALRHVGKSFTEVFLPAGDFEKSPIGIAVAKQKRGEALTEMELQILEVWDINTPQSTHPIHQEPVSVEVILQLMHGLICPDGKGGFVETEKGHILRALLEDAPQEIRVDVAGQFLLGK